MKHSPLIFKSCFTETEKLVSNSWLYRYFYLILSLNLLQKHNFLFYIPSPKIISQSRFFRSIFQHHVRNYVMESVPQAKAFGNVVLCQVNLFSSLQYLYISFDHVKMCHEFHTRHMQGFANLYVHRTSFFKQHSKGQIFQGKHCNSRNAMLNVVYYYC